LDGKDKKVWGGDGSGRNPLHFFLFSSGRSKTVFWVFYTFFLKKLGWNFFGGDGFVGRLFLNEFLGCVCVCVCSFFVDFLKFHPPYFR
jgi:hypothetical protein